MDNTTTVLDFQVTKNQALGRLSQCTSLSQLKFQLQLECDKIPFEHQMGEGISPAEQAALIGQDITDGINRANDVLDGKIDDL